MTDAALHEAYAFLRAHTTGDLRFDEHLRPIRYVIEPGGRLVAPVMVAMLHAVDVVLFVPEVADGAMELQLTLVEFDERGAPAGAPLSGGGLADRWRIHHGDPPDVNWALVTPDAARHEGHVIDGVVFRRENPLAADEAGLCRAMNRDRRDDLRVLATRFAGVNLEDPVMVAADPLGIDVRGRFDIVRVPAAEPMPTAADARRVLEAMIGEARARA
jgi:hypothetical protein